MLNRTFKGALATCAVFALVPFLAAPDAVRTYVSGNFTAEIAGMDAFLLKSFDGGVAVAMPATRTRTNDYTDKSPGALKYEDAELRVGFSAPKPLWDWVSAFSTPSKPTSKEVVINALDYTMTSKSRRQLGATTLSKVVFPGCDGSSKEPAYVTLDLTPTRFHEIAGTGKTTSTLVGRSEQKTWLPSNFRLTIDGLDTSKVNKIEPITITHSAGGSPDYSNLVITMSEVTSTSMKQWMNQVLDPVSKGAAVFQEKKGKLEFLSPDQAKVLLTLVFEGLGPVKLLLDKVEANADQIKRVTAELYVERITVIAP